MDCLYHGYSRNSFYRLKDEQIRDEMSETNIQLYRKNKVVRQDLCKKYHCQ